MKTLDSMTPTFDDPLKFALVKAQLHAVDGEIEAVVFCTGCRENVIGGTKNGEPAFKCVQCNRQFDEDTVGRTFGQTFVSSNTSY